MLKNIWIQISVLILLFIACSFLFIYLYHSDPPQSVLIGDEKVKESVLIKVGASDMDCQQVIDNLQKSVCEKVVWEGQNDCEQFTEAAEEDWCWYYRAQLKEDFSICEKIGCAYVRSDCYSNKK